MQYLEAHHIPRKPPEAKADLTAQSAALAALCGTHRSDRIASARSVPADPGCTEPWPSWVPATVQKQWAERGVPDLWRHQNQALTALWAGEHVLVATGTASGKSLPYQALAATMASGCAPTWWQPHRYSTKPPTTLYLAPTKALAADQVRGFAGANTVQVAAVDGDASAATKDWARTEADVVCTNPDWVHSALLPAADRWQSFLQRLAVIVVDEAHHYRGVFGAHVALTLRRLLRVLEHWQVHPRVYFSSATCANPTEHVKALTGLTVTAITHDSSAKPPREYLLWQPPISEQTKSRRSAAHEAAELLCDTVPAQVQVLAFTRARAATEALAGHVQAHLPQAARGRVAAYRGGYLPEERRELEARLRSGELLALTSTSALELGIDVAGLAVVMVVGWPGTRSALWQRWGRAGRGDDQAVLVFIARDDPLDQYFLTHPEALFDTPVEHVVLDPTNPTVLAAHLLAAAAEVPLTAANTVTFGPDALALVEHLTTAGYLRQRGHSWYWTKPYRPTSGLSLRGASQNYDLVDADTGAIIGTLGSGSLDQEAHPGAVYVHQNRSYLVHDVIDEEHTILVRQRPVTYRTWAQGTTAVQVDQVSAQVASAGWVRHRGWLQVGNQVTHYLRKCATTGEQLGRHPVTLPVRTFRTQGVWWTFTYEFLDQVGLDEETVPGALHAAEHTLIGLLGVAVTCDRWDVGGLATPTHPETGLPSLFVYDAHPGGAGFSYGGYQNADAWVRATVDHLATCSCVAGCPACVQSPKCGSGNEPLHKAGALALLRGVLTNSPQPLPAE